MNLTNHITILIENFSQSQGLKPSTVCKHMMGDGAIYMRLKNGHTITIRRYYRIIRWFSENWPADLAWPNDIERPTLEKKE